MRVDMTNNERTLKALHDLIATCNDAAEGFAKAAKGVHDTDLSNWLAAASADRERFADDLSHALKEMGEESRLDLHEGGILHKGWVDLEQRLRSTGQHLHSKDDKEILRECIAGDSGSLTHYDHALAQDLLPDLRQVVVQQRAAIEDTLVHLQNRVSRQQSQTA
jgi:uncharacterized protein (TIGR02284 family)